MSFNTENKGVVVANIVDEDGRADGTVSYDAHDRKEIDADDVPDELLEAVYGARHVQPNSPKKREQYRRMLADEINREALGKYSEARTKEGQTFRPVPPSIGGSRERDVWFVSGQSGSGKSTFAAHLLDEYRDAGQRVFVITDVPDDKFGDCHYLDIHDLVGVSTSFEDKKRKYEAAKIRFKHRKKEMSDEERIEAEIMLSEMKPAPSTKHSLELKITQEQLETLFRDSVLLLDDYENNADARLISFLRDHLLTKGRHSNTSVIICNHLTNSGSAFRLIMTESTNFVVFAKSSAHSRAYLLTKYLGADNQTVRMVSKSLKKSRWVSFDRVLDIFLTQHRAFTYRPT